MMKIALPAALLIGAVITINVWHAGHVTREASARAQACERLKNNIRAASAAGLGMHATPEEYAAADLLRQLKVKTAERDYLLSRCPT
jgi:hypothetical protein